MSDSANSSNSPDDGWLIWPNNPTLKYKPASPVWWEPVPIEKMVSGGEDLAGRQDPGWLEKRVAEERAKHPEIPPKLDLEDIRAEIAELKQRIPKLSLEQWYQLSLQAEAAHKKAAESGGDGEDQSPA